MQSQRHLSNGKCFSPYFELEPTRIQVFCRSTSLLGQTINFANSRPAIPHPYFMLQPQKLRDSKFPVIEIIIEKVPNVM